MSIVENLCDFLFAPFVALFVNAIVLPRFSVRPANFSGLAGFTLYAQGAKFWVCRSFISFIERVMMKKTSLVGGVYFTFLASGFMMMIMGAIMPYLIEEYGISYNTAGTYLSLFACGNLFSSYYIHWFIKRFGKKTSIVVFSSLVTIGYLTLTLTQIAAILAGCFLFIGVGRGSISNVDNSLINDYAPGESKYLNYLHMFFAVGAFLAPLAVVALMGLGLTWKGVVLCCLALSSAMFLVYCILPIDNTPKPRNMVAETSEGKKSIFSDTSFFLGCGLLFFYVGAENAMVGWLVTYLRNSGIMSGSQAQYAFSSLWIVMIVGRFISAHLASVVKNTTILLVGALAALIMFGVFIVSVNPYVLLVAILGIGLFFAPMYPTTISVCGRLLQGNTKAMGTLLAVAGLGGVIIPYVVGFLADLFGIYIGMTSIIFSVFCMFCFAFFLKRQTERADNLAAVQSRG